MFGLEETFLLESREMFVSRFAFGFIFNLHERRSVRQPNEKVCGLSINQKLKTL